MKSSMEYKNLEKLLKKHYGNSKFYYINIGRNISIRYPVYSKNVGTIELLGEDGETTGYFYNSFVLNLNKQNSDNTIMLSVWTRGNRDAKEILSEKITNLDRLFKLLSNKGQPIKDMIEKKLVITKLTQEQQDETYDGNC